jgi:hypothetical protein
LAKFSARGRDFENLQPAGSRRQRRQRRRFGGSLVGRGARLSHRLLRHHRHRHWNRDCFRWHIYHGRTGAAAEGGHNTIDYRGPRCGCGKLGCIEALASGPAIARRASEKIAKEGRLSSILEMAERHPERITSEMVGRAYRCTEMRWPGKS